jgi:hypothetical protein
MFNRAPGETVVLLVQGNAVEAQMSRHLTQTVWHRVFDNPEVALAEFNAYCVLVVTDYGFIHVVTYEV